MTLSWTIVRGSPARWCRERHFLYPCLRSVEVPNNPLELSFQLLKTIYILSLVYSPKCWLIINFYRCNGKLLNPVLIYPKINLGLVTLPLQMDVFEYKLWVGHARIETNESCSSRYNHRTCHKFLLYKRFDSNRNIQALGFLAKIFYDDFRA